MGFVGLLWRDASGGERREDAVGADKVGAWHSSFMTLRPGRSALVPVQPGRVSIYHCGLTVQGPPHIGHIRKEVVFDVLRRWLERSGYEVTIVANVTDIDDKILAKAAEAGPPWFAARLRERARAARRRTTCSAACRRRTSRGPPATCPR